MAKKLSSDEMLAGILSYIGILVLIPLLAIKKKNDFINFHVKQGMNLLILEVIISVGVYLLSWIPFLGAITYFVWSIVSIALVVVCIIAIVKAVGNEKWKIPVLGDVKIYK